MIVLDVLGQISRKQLNDWRADDRWHIRETIEHLIGPDDLAHAFKMEGGSVSMRELFKQLRELVLAVPRPDGLFARR